MFKNIGSHIGVTVITTVTIGALALIGNFATSGGLVKFLGGVPKADLEAMIGHPHDAPPEPVAAMPKNAVVAFDTPDACPDEWSPFAPAASRVIIGAYNGGDAGRFALDPADQPLTQYKYRDHDGWESVKLTVDQMAEHKHNAGNLKTEDADPFIHSTSLGLGLSGGTPGGLFKANLNPASGPDYGAHSHMIKGLTDVSGRSEPHPNMPPYIALYFCKKD